MQPDLHYAAAVIHFLDRNSQTTTAMTYPITRIELTELHDKEVVTSQIFVVNDEDHWVKVQ